MPDHVTTNDLEPFWMPFTANRQFKKAPRIFVSAEGMYYKTDDGRDVIDGSAGLWCVNAGHKNPKIVEAVQKQVAELDYAPSFQMSHPKAFELASRLTAIAPQGIDNVFFTNSGSEAVETALKIAIAYQRQIGQGTRTRLIGRERGYHGVNFGGISVGGMVNNRKTFGSLLGGVDHIRHTHDLTRNAYSIGVPKHGADYAEDLERLVALHDASTIAAVIVEPVAGSTGALIAPEGYLKRLREICDTHGILLIFDEVITGFGRLGAPFASDFFGVVPDIMTTAKGLTNGVIPMGAVFVKKEIYDAFMVGDDAGIELFHGYTYSANPIACAAALAALDAYQEGDLLTRAADLDSQWAKAAHSLKGLPHVKDIRNIGLMAGIELEQRPDAPGARQYDAFLKCLEKGLYFRVSGDSITLSPPLIIKESEIDHIFSIVADVKKSLDEKNTPWTHFEIVRKNTTLTL